MAQSTSRQPNGALLIRLVYKNEPKKSQAHFGG